MATWAGTEELTANCNTPRQPLFADLLLAKDLLPVSEHMDFLSDDDRLKIVGGNAKRLFSRLRLPAATG